MSQRRLSQPWSAAAPARVKKHRTHTCPITDDRAELGAEEHIHVVQDELHHHRLDPHLHEGGRAAEAGGLDLLGPAKGHLVRKRLLLGEAWAPEGLQGLGLGQKRCQGSSGVKPQQCSQIITDWGDLWPNFRSRVKSY